MYLRLPTRATIDLIHDISHQHHRLGGSWCCRENISVTWSLRGQTAGFAVNSYVNIGQIYMWYRKVEISFKRSLKIPENRIQRSFVYIKTWEKRSVAPCTDVTTIEDIRIGNYSGDGFRWLRKFQFNDKLFWYNLFLFHRYIYHNIIIFCFKRNSNPQYLSK